MILDAKLEKMKIFMTNSRIYFNLAAAKHFDNVFKKRIRKWIDRINAWRLRHVTDRQFMLLLSLPTGFLAGLAAVAIKKLAHGIRDGLLSIHFSNSDLLYLLFPALGILLTIVFCRFILKKEVGHGIPGILYAISKKKADKAAPKRVKGA